VRVSSQSAYAVYGREALSFFGILECFWPMLRAYRRIPEQLLCSCRRTAPALRKFCSQSHPGRSYLGRFLSILHRQRIPAPLSHLTFQRISGLAAQQRQWLQPCRGLRSTVKCSANPPKTVHDIVRRLTRGEPQCCCRARMNTHICILV
jgi:hypothetical protein